MKKEFTIGGMPASEAWTWSERTYQKLGDSILLLASSRAENQREGYVRLLKLQRNFMRDTWDQMITRLNAFRKEHHLPAVEELTALVSQDLVKKGRAQDRPDRAEPASMPQLADLAPVQPAITPGPLPLRVGPGVLQESFL